MASNLESSLAAKGSDTIWDFSCDACNKKEAQFYCEGCAKCYCDNCVKLHSQLFDSHSVFSRERMNEWPIAKSTLDILEQCEEHSDEKIKLFCEDHSRLCCHICVALHHRSCSKVSLIDEANKYSTTDVHQLSSNIQKIQEELKELNDRAECNLQSLEKAYERIKNEIDTVRQKINAELDRLENATIQAVDELIETSKISMTKERDECDIFQKSLQCLSEVLNEVCNKNSKLLFIAVEKCQQQVKDSELFLKELNNAKIYDLDFAPNNDIEKFISNLTSLGRINQPTSLGRINQPNKVISLQKMSEYSVTMSPVRFTCYTYAICELPSGETLVLDSGNKNNKKVKLLDKKYKLVGHCEVSNYSYDMCLIPQSEVVVTTNEQQGDGKHSLQMITVRNERLEKGKMLQLSHMCVGIAHHEGDLYVTSGKALYQYSMIGRLVKKLYEDTTGDNTVYKCAVNLVGDNIYVTNMTKHSLLTLAMDGTVISTFSDLDLKDPRGVHVTPGGQVLVCGGSSNTIIQIDREGRKKLATLSTEKDGIKCPWSVFYSCNTDSVIVGFACYTSSIMVFKVT